MNTDNVKLGHDKDVERTINYNLQSIEDSLNKIKYIKENFEKIYEKTNIKNAGIDFNNKVVALEMINKEQDKIRDTMEHLTNAYYEQYKLQKYHQENYHYHLKKLEEYDKKELTDDEKQTYNEIRQYCLKNLADCGYDIKTEYKELKRLTKNFGRLGYCIEYCKPELLEYVFKKDDIKEMCKYLNKHEDQNEIYVSSMKNVKIPSECKEVIYKWGEEDTLLKPVEC